MEEEWKLWFLITLISMNSESDSFILKASPERMLHIMRNAFAHAHKNFQKIFPIVRHICKIQQTVRYISLAIVEQNKWCLLESCWRLQIKEFSLIFNEKLWMLDVETSHRWNVYNRWGKVKMSSLVEAAQQCCYALMPLWPLFNSIKSINHP